MVVVNDAKTNISSVAELVTDDKPNVATILENVTGCWHLLAGLAGCWLLAGWFELGAAG